MADITKIKKAALIPSNILFPEASQHYHCNPMSGRKSNEAQAFIGGFCLVFPMEENGGSKKIGYRVWYIDNLNHQLLQIAKEVGQELSKNKLPYFVGYRYLEEALDVEGNIIPGVQMEWVNGDTLDDYIRKHRSPSDLRELADSFLKMCRDMSNAGIAHGDLSNSNILIDNNGNIRLVDYDSLYFPSMHNKYRQTTAGQPAFQHPQRINGLPMTAKDDNFSQLVIYTSLLAMSAEPALIDLIGEQELIFNNIDLKNKNNFRNSRAYRELPAIADPQLKTCLNELEHAIESPLSEVPSLVDIFKESSKTEFPQTKSSTSINPPKTDFPKHGSQDLLGPTSSLQKAWDRMKSEQKADDVGTIKPKWIKPLRLIILLGILVEYIIISIHETQFGSWGLVTFGFFNTFAFIITMVLCLFANNNDFDDKKEGWRKYYEWLHFIPSAIIPVLGYLIVSNIQNIMTLLLESLLLGILLLVNFGTIETIFSD